MVVRLDFLLGARGARAFPSLDGDSGRGGSRIFSREGRLVQRGGIFRVVGAVT